jgi:pimeloyl-ACP methyl ester carboxylesterase
MGDYLDDVQSATDSLGSQPVLIGHSMGGFIVQKYLAKRRAPAAVLMASIPPQGVLGRHCA